MAIEDRCRVCEGDGTACRTVLGFVNDSFENRQKALKTTNGSYHLNGKKEVSWPMTYAILGTRFHYMRTKSHHEFLHALGPLSEELIVMLLLEEPNKGVVFSYNIPLEALSDQDRQYRSWTKQVKNFEITILACSYS
ncbi:A disintegrin and metalloproteinase with thrombospondin motifs 6-like isoform X2 [Tachypleus tridentatus]|uniref:A disintegrin and metalloproteinase with thrombospondin motifs 6-like isoform X2 n=1 Tax=Tachypleus tridentatus TaxID=6853 RepID=UPI003FD08D10